MPPFTSPSPAVNGPSEDPVFGYLKSQKGGLLGNDIKWNFRCGVDHTGADMGAEPHQGELQVYVWKQCGTSPDVWAGKLVKNAHGGLI